MTQWVRWLGLATVLAAAAVLSFHGLRDLALAVSIPVRLAWLLPVAVDAGAAVSCACWLSRSVPADAARFARAQTWLLLAGTVIGNAGQLGMHAHGITPPWWVAVLVGAIPPTVVGGCVHLAVLVGRGEPTAMGEVPTGTDSAVEGLVDEPPAEAPAPMVESAVESGPTEESAADRPPVEPPLTDGEIIADVREWAVDLGRRPSRDDMLARYRIGATRARRIRNTLGWIDPVDEPDRLPTGAAS